MFDFNGGTPGVRAIPLRTFAERAWYAYLCLPAGRGERSRVTEVMGRHRRDLKKLFIGHREDVRPRLRELVASALRVSQAWLDRGEGEPPRLVIAYRPRPIDPDARSQDPAEWARKYDAMGGVPGRNPNNFQAAALFFRSDLDARAIEHVAKAARGREQSQTVGEWALRLRLAQIRITGTGWNLRLPLP